VNQKSFKKIFIGAAVLFVVLFVGGAMAFKAAQSGGSGAVSAATLATLDRAHAPSVGSVDAPVVIVEFLDPACETCAVFYPLVKGMMDANPGKIRLVLRWAPFHNGSPNVVALLEAARKQDKFWPALEALLRSQTAWTVNHTADVSAAWMQLAGLGLDQEQIQADMGSASVQQNIQQDLADAAALNVTMTPEYFVNGKPMPSFGLEQLMGLVNEALEETSR
jgi:protein-disulfide isomerase